MALFYIRDSRIANERISFKMSGLQPIDWPMCTHFGVMVIEFVVDVEQSLRESAKFTASLVFQLGLE
jgi:hypothetical protein